MKKVKNKKTGKMKKKKVRKRVKLKPQARPLLSNLAIQISFSNTPNPSAGMAITKTSAATAAACAALRPEAGRRRVLLLRLRRLDAPALPAARRSLALRPNAPGTAASGGVKPPKK